MARDRSEDLTRACYERVFVRLTIAFNGSGQDCLSGMQSYPLLNIFHHLCGCRVRLLSSLGHSFPITQSSEFLLSRREFPICFGNHIVPPTNLITETVDLGCYGIDV